ncbi:unnamed protein product, partial [Musa textilis]
SLSFSVGLYLRFFYHLFVEVKLQNEYEPFINGRKIIMRHRSDPESSMVKPTENLELNTNPTSGVICNNTSCS